MSNSDLYHYRALEMVKTVTQSSGLIEIVEARLTQNRVGLLPLWTNTEPDKVTWWVTIQIT